MSKKDILIGILIALFLAVFISQFASPHPDGLEKVAEEKGFIDKAASEACFDAPAADYSWPNCKSETSATAAAGAFGVAVAFLTAAALAAVLRRR